MPIPIAVAPTYAIGDLSHILEIEQRQIEDTVADLNENRVNWHPHPKAKSTLEILWHLAYAQVPNPKPATKAEALTALRKAYEVLQRDIASPGKLDEPFQWWTGETIPYRGVIWAAIRHRTYHLGELVYLRQVMGLDEPKYYHEE
jgi:hypothetical protein